MRRNEFLTLLGGTVLAWPFAAHAQQRAMPVIGYLSSSAAGSSPESVAAFHRGLSEAGFVEGRNVAIDYRSAEGQIERLPGLAADLVRRQVAVIVALANAAAIPRRSGSRSRRRCCCGRTR